MAGEGRPSTTLLAARRKAVDGRPSPAMTGWVGPMRPETTCDARSSHFATDLADLRQFLKRVEWRRRGDRPFQRRGTLAPVIVGKVLLRGEGAEHHIQEHQKGDPADIGPNRRDIVPAGERLRIVG